MPKPPSGPDGAKNVTISIRMTPKMRFGLDLMTRLHSRPMADVVTYAIEEVFTSEIEGLWDHNGPEEVGGKRYLLSLLWAERASDRFANIALHCPQLLTTAERRMWSRILHMPELWSCPERGEPSLKREVLAQQWAGIQEHFSLGGRGQDLL